MIPKQLMFAHERYQHTPDNSPFLFGLLAGEAERGIVRISQ